MLSSSWRWSSLPLAALLFAAFAAATPASADEAVLILDRPAFASSPSVLDPGVLYLEAGALHQRGRGGTDQLSGILVRAQLGLLPRLELETGAFLVEVFDTDSDEAHASVGDGYLCGRVRLFDGMMPLVPRLGLEVGISLPYAQLRPELGTGRVDLNGGFLAEWSFESGFTFGAHVGVAGENLEGTGRFRAQEFAIANASFSFEAAMPYLEFAWFATRGVRRTSDVAVLNAGFVWTFANNVALDGVVTVGLTDAAPAIGFGLGLAVTLDPLW